MNNRGNKRSAIMLKGIRATEGMLEGIRATERVDVVTESWTRVTEMDLGVIDGSTIFKRLCIERTCRLVGQGFILIVHRGIRGRKGSSTWARSISEGDFS